MAKARKRVRILSVSEFRQRFGTAEQCAVHLARTRWPEGFVCPRCGGRRFSALARRGLHQCSACRRQTSLTAETIFHKSRVPLDKWFWAIYRLAQDKKGCSALLLSKELDVCYPTAWLMAHKIRHAMAEKALNNLLQGVVELDDAYLGGARRGQPGYHGRGAKGKTPLLVAVETTADRTPGRAAVAAVKTLHKTRVTRFVTATLAQGCRVRTDKLGGFQHLRTLGYDHEAVKVGTHSKIATKIFPQVHLLISNLKRFLLGRHHAIAGKHASRYVGEFTYRFNQRWREANLFDSLLKSCVRSKVITYPQLRLAELR
jgi:transcription elongation factor Elf1